ncbi:hypothetical protein RB195_007591 [Necator americanus]
MLVKNRTHFRHTTLHHLEKDRDAAQLFRDLNYLFGDGTVSKSQVERMFGRFKSGNTNLADEEGRGRPSDFDHGVLLAALEEGGSLKTRMLADDIIVSHSDHSSSSQKYWEGMGIR